MSQYAVKELQLNSRLTDMEYFRRRYKKARATSDLWISLLEACYHYTCPSRNLFYWSSQFQGSQKNARVYDTTPVAALRTFVSKVQNALTPPQSAFAYLEAGSDIPEDEKERVNEYLQKSTNIIFDYIRHSNFDLASHEAYHDLGVGTAALICQEGPDSDPLQFYSVPLARLAMEQSTTGIIETNYRWWDEIPIRDIEVMWPNAVLTPTMQMLVNEDPNAIIKELVEGTVYLENPKNRYVYVLFHENDFLLKEDLGNEPGVNPWITFRWSKVNNEVYGRGPVVDALPSILSLQELARLELASANFNVSKPWMAYSDGIFNPWTFKIEPNTIIPVAPNSNGQWPIQAFPDSAKPEFFQLTSLDLRMQINKLMYADPLGPVESPQKTATEIAVRQRSFTEEIGPVYSRLQQEYLSRLIDRVMYILQKKGFLEKLLINGREIKIRYQSPLVIAQGEQDVQTFSKFYQILQATYGPEAASVYLDPVEYPAWLSNKLGVDQTPLNTKEEMTKMFAEQSEKAQQQEEMAMMGGMEGMGGMNG